MPNLARALVIDKSGSMSCHKMDLAKEAAIAADGITLSTVGIGEGADMRLMEDLASWGNGESYFTNDFGSIPQIFTRETMRASKSMLIEEPFVPTQVAQSEIMKGIALDDMPFLLGYVGCQGKDRATISLVSDYGDPVLASWTFGLGRSVAFTSDAKAHWAADWISWESYPKFWAFQATFPIERYGEAYRVLLVNKQADEVVALRAFGVTESYSPEFRTAAPDLERLELVARSTGGVLSPDRAAIWKFDGEPARTPKDTWWWWLVIAAILLPLDTALHRLSS